MTHGWYNRATGLEMVSGCGIDYGVLKLYYENGEYVIDEYNEYMVKQLLDPEIGFPVSTLQEAQEVADIYYSSMKEEKERKVIDYFWLEI